MKPKDVLADKFTNTHKNRRIFHDAIAQKIAHAKEHHHAVGLLLIDLDNFQTINRHHGHLVGDDLLFETHKRLASCLTSDDFLTRVDGDEFAVILGNITDPKTIEDVIYKLMNCFNDSYHLKGTKARINASIGAACYPDAGNDAQTLIQSAAICMTHAKSLGGNNYQYFTQKILEKYKRKSFIENALKFALENKELFVTYQPIFNLSTKEMVGMEALLRWRHPAMGLISPDIFIELAEKNGLIASIGEWALKTICKQAQKWYKAGHNSFKIAFNISSNQLLLKSFPQSIIKKFRNSHIPTHLIDLELTETAFLRRASYFKKILTQIAKTGISITIDDFGTGHSSLIRLKDLPIKTLKIDKSFVFNITPDSFDAIIINALINLGKKLGLNVIAEGIETEADLQFLIANDCPEGQGYYLCKPLSAKQMTTYLNKKKNDYDKK